MEETAEDVKSTNDLLTGIHESVTAMLKPVSDKSRFAISGINTSKQAAFKETVIKSLKDVYLKYLNASRSGVKLSLDQKDRMKRAEMYITMVGGMLLKRFMEPYDDKAAWFFTLVNDKDSSVDFLLSNPSSNGLDSPSMLSGVVKTYASIQHELNEINTRVTTLGDYLAEVDLMIGWEAMFTDPTHLRFYVFLKDLKAIHSSAVNSDYATVRQALRDMDLALSGDINKGICNLTPAKYRAPYFDKIASIKRHFEKVLLLSENLPEEQVQKHFQELAQFLVSNGSDIIDMFPGDSDEEVVFKEKMTFAIDLADAAYDNDTGKFVFILNKKTFVEAMGDARDAWYYIIDKQGGNVGNAESDLVSVAKKFSANWDKLKTLLNTLNKRFQFLEKLGIAIVYYRNTTLIGETLFNNEVSSAFREVILDVINLKYPGIDNVHEAKREKPEVVEEEEVVVVGEGALTMDEKIGEVGAEASAPGSSTSKTTFCRRCGLMKRV